jgi:hypothetical protein
MLSASGMLAKSGASGTPLDMDTLYTLAAPEYMATSGKEGFDMLPEGKVVVDGEEGMALPIMFKQLFKTMSAMQGTV